MRSFSRPAFECARELEHYREHNRTIFPQLELTPDLNRGEWRFAAEVAVDVMHGRDVPSFAQDRALTTLRVLAKG